MVLMLVLGVLIVTTEFRHGTSSSTFLASPRRYPVLLAKLGASLLVGLAGRPRLRRRQRRAHPVAGRRARWRPAPHRRPRLGLCRRRRLVRDPRRLRPRRRRDRPQPGRRDHRRDRLLLRPLPPARTAARVDRRILPGPGARRPARPCRRRRRPRPGQRRLRPRRLGARPLRDRHGADLPPRPRRLKSLRIQLCSPYRGLNSGYAKIAGGRWSRCRRRPSRPAGACASRRRRSRRSARPRPACRCGRGGR